MAQNNQIPYQPTIITPTTSEKSTDQASAVTPTVTPSTGTSLSSPPTTVTATQSAAIAEKPASVVVKPATVVAPSAGVPLSQVKAVVEQQQSQQHAAMANQGTIRRPLYEYTLVTVQLISLGVILFGFIPPILWQLALLQIIGVLLVGVGIFLAIWAFFTFKQRMRILPEPTENGFLVMGGPFNYVRHPMYVALMIIGFGLSIAFPSIPRLIAYALLIFVLTKKVVYEEKLLAYKYTGYESYRRHTGKFFPKIGSPKLVVANSSTQKEIENTSKLQQNK